MSIGNLKDSGNQGNNFPWQLKVLQGLQCICDELKAININTDAIEELLAEIETNTADIVTNTNAYVRTPVISRVSTSGTVPSGVYSVSFANVGSGNGTVGGATFKPGETINFDAGALNNTLSTSFSYDATGTDFLIIYIQ